ncbi:GIY-YIG nuclease family protein [Spirillospora sp. NPDC049652]
MSGDPGTPLLTTHPSEVTMPAPSIGFVYVLSNEAMPGFVKVGMTRQLSEIRARKLRTTGVPLPFKVEFRTATCMPTEVEQAAHTALNDCRVSSDREFFRTTPSQATKAVRGALLEAAGLEAWSPGWPDNIDHHFVRSRDRLALHLRAGDLLAVLARPELASREADLLDIWEAHSDGDQVELLGAHAPEYVAGMSDYDPGAGADPVPHLDRDRTAPNGILIGRERFVPGDQLLWLRSQQEGRMCRAALFEVEDYVQVIGRTWDPKMGPFGIPLILNDLVTETPPQGVIQVTQKVMQKHQPRSWAPRQPLVDDGGGFGDHPQPPGYWMPQLDDPRPPNRRKRNHDTPDDEDPASR